MTDEDFRRMMGYDPDPNATPLPAAPPSGGYLPHHMGVDVPPSTFQGNYFPPNMPHGGMDVPPGTFPPPAPNIPGQVNIFSERNPPDVSFAPNYWGGELPPINTNDPFRNPSPNETMYPDGKYYLGDPNTTYNTQPGFGEDPFPGFPNEPFPTDFSKDAPDFNNQGFPDSVYNPPTNEGMFPAYPGGGENPVTQRYFNDTNVNEIINSSPVGFDPIQNPSPNETMYPNDMGYFPPDVPPDYSSTVDPGMIQGIQPLPPDIYQQIWGWEDQPNQTADTSAPAVTDQIQYGDEGTMPIDQPPGNALPGPATFPLNTPNTGANGVLGTNPNIWGTSPSTQPPVFLPNQGVTNPDGTPMIGKDGDVIAGTMLSDADVAKRRAMEQFPNDPRYTWRDSLHPGQTMVKLMSDGTRVLVDATGKIISGGIQAGKDLWHNILNDPRNTTPADLTAAGYNEGQGKGSLFPQGVTGPTGGYYDTGNYGVMGEGGSFFHGGASVGATLPGPHGYVYPSHGATSVAGAFANLGGSGPISLEGTAWGRMMNANYLRRMQKGLYTSPGDYSKGVENAPSPFAGTPSPMSGGGNWNAFHAGQVQLGDILRANPAYYQSITNSAVKTGLGPSTPGSRITRGTPPPQPT